MNIRRNQLKQRGDTIVEVLIVLAIVGSALGISYAIASGSLKGVRQAQEHSEALQIAQAQIEQLRVAVPIYAASGNSVALRPTAGNVICMKPDATPTASFIQPVAPPFDLTAYTPGECQINSQYGVAVSYDATVGHEVYTVQVRWEDAAGNSTLDNLDLVYKVFTP